MSLHWCPGDALARVDHTLRQNDHGRTKRSVSIEHIKADGYSRPAVISMSKTDIDIKQAESLVNARYDWRGYGSGHKISTSDQHVTFITEIMNTVTGTITLSIDGASGLALDQTFPDQIRELRSDPGRRLCELTKFAFAESESSKELMAALFHVVFVYGQRTFDCTDILIEVNPRHVRFYESMLGFSRLGPTQNNASVDAPSQLMALRVADIRRQVDQAALSEGRSRSLYSYFLPPAQEAMIYRAFTRNDGTANSHRARRQPDTRLSQHGTPSAVHHNEARV